MKMKKFIWPGCLFPIAVLIGIYLFMMYSIQPFPKTINVKGKNFSHFRRDQNLWYENHDQSFKAAAMINLK